MKNFTIFFYLINIKYNRFALLASLQFLLVMPCISQGNHDETDSYYVQHFGEKEGLENSVYGLLSDKNDFLWVAASNGIALFNGSRFVYIDNEAFQYQNTFNSVGSIHKGNKDTILAYSSFLRKVAVIVNNKIVSIEDQKIERQGFLFSNQKSPVAAPPYIKGNKFTSAFGIKEKWNTNSFRMVGGPFGKNLIWIVLRDGIGFYDQRGTVNRIQIPGIDMREVVSSGDYILYLDKYNYLNYYNAKGFKKRVLLSRHIRKSASIFPNYDGDGFYYVIDSCLYKATIATSGKLINRKLISNLQSPFGISVVLEKDSNTIIVGTSTNGLYVYKKNFLKVSEQLPDGSPSAFFSQWLLQDSQTIIAGHGYVFKDGVFCKKKINHIDQTYFDFLRDRNGNVWYGSNGYILRTRQIGQKPDTINKMNGTHVQVLLEDKDGRIWVASEFDFGYIQDGRYTPVKMKNLEGRQITCVKQDNSGKYFIGTEWGLFSFNSAEQITADKIPNFSPAHIKNIITEANGNIWVFTYGNGFFYISKDKITAFPLHDEGLAFLHTMIEDARGYCWFPSNKGLFVTTKKSLIEYINDETKTPFFYMLSVKDGLRTNEFNGGTESAYLRLSNGDFSLTSMDGLVQFNPAKIHFDFSSFPILIDRISLDSIRIQERNDFKISANIKNIHFSIMSSYWGNEENYSLEYQVKPREEALEKDQWFQVDELGNINLFAPVHGNYQLIIRKRTGFAANDYLYNTVDFYIEPKWYQTKIFYAAIVLAVVLIIIIILSLRKNYDRRANEILKKKIKVATAELFQANMTLEKKVEERTLEIQRSEIKSRTLVEKSQVGVYIIQDNKFIYVNPRFEELTGYTTDNAVGMNPLMLFEGRDLIIVTEKIRQRMSGEVESDRYEIEGRKKDGTFCQWELFCSRTIYEGKITLLGTMLDITERTEIQKELREAEQKFRDLVEKSMVGVYITTGKKLVYVNPRYAEMFGYSQDELIGMNAVPITVYEEDKELVEKNIQLRMEGKVEAVHYEFRAVKKDGSIMYAEAFGRITQFEGNPAIIGTMIDITEKKLAEEQLIKEKNLSQSIINNLPGIFYIFNQDLKYLLWNKNFEIVTGYSKEELSEIRLDQLTTRENLSSVSKVVGRIFTHGYSETEAILLCKDGTEIPYFFNGITVNYNDKICALGVGFDISERKKAQQEREFAIDALQKSEANLNTIFLNTDTVYILLNTELKVIAYNQRGYDYIKKLYNGHLIINTDLTEYLAPSRRKSFREEAIEVMKGNQNSYERKYAHPNGELSWYYVRKFPVLHSSQNPLGIMLVVSDITEKKLMEQEILNQKVQEQKKVVRAILAGEEKERNKIGQELHDNINQILAGVKLYLGTIEHDQSGNEHIIKRSIHFLDSAIEEIRDLSKFKITPTKKTNLPELLQVLADRLYIATKIQIRYTFEGSHSLIDEDLKLNIYRIVQEQLNNIIKHADAKNIYIGVSVNEENIRLSVSDDGKGFDVESKKTGIGLTNMTNRVEVFNGTIHIESSPGNGAKIDINLPL